MEELSKCPVCGGEVVERVHDSMSWYECKRCDLQAHGDEFGGSAKGNYRLLCAIIAEHLAPRADLDRVTAERDAHLTAIRATFRVLAERGQDPDDNAPLEVVVRRVLDALGRVTAERDAAVAELERLHGVVADVTGERDAANGVLAAYMEGQMRWCESLKDLLAKHDQEEGAAK